MASEQCLRQEAVGKGGTFIFKAQIYPAAGPVTLSMVPVITATVS